MNNTFLDNFNELTNNKYSFLRLGGVKYNEDTENNTLDVEITFIVPYDIYNDLEKFNDEVKDDIENVTHNLMPEGVKYKIKYEKLKIAPQVVKRLVSGYIKDNYIRLLNGKFFPDDIEVDIKDDIVNILIPVADTMKYFADTKIKPGLEEFLNVQYNAQNSIKFKPVEIKRAEEFEVHQTQMAVDDGMIELFERGEKFVGEKFPDPPIYISKYIRPTKDATICGNIIAIDKKVAKSGKLFYVLQIQDVTLNTLKCLYFVKKEGATKSKMDNLKVGDELIINGDLVEDSFAGAKKLSMFINNIMFCKIDKEKTLKKIEHFKKLVKKTKVPEPEIYQEENEEKPLTLFDDIPYLCPLLRDKTYTVFDLETTGLIDNGVVPNIVEIGAVRVQNGVITHKFSTLVDPEMHIPEAASNTNHILDYMVEDAPFIRDAIGPFLKFAQNTVLVGHNIARFDIPIIEHFAKECGYKFDFKILDTLQMAQQSGIQLKSFSLASCLNYFHLQNENAHRALTDTIANAKLFIELANYMKL